MKNGWTVGLNGNIFGFTGQNMHGRRLQQGGHWLAQHLFEHYAFNQDRAYLEEVYPILKGAAEFFFEHLAPWKDGTLVVYPTWSPENYFLEKEFGKLNKVGWGASYDQQLLVNLFTDCIEASIILDRDPEFRQTLREFIPKLCPQKINSLGHVQEWPDDWNDYEVMPNTETERPTLLKLALMFDDNYLFSLATTTCFWFPSLLPAGA